MTLLHVHDALIGPQYEPSGPVKIEFAEDGTIASIQPAPRPEGPARLAIPALADAHNHARPLSTTSFGCGAQPLEQWLPHLAIMPSVDAYVAAAASLARSLKGGATSVMVHLTRAMGQKPLPDEARDMARAATDVGVSIGFAISMRDRNPLIYGDHEPLLAKLSPENAALVRETWLKPLPAIADQLALVDAVAEALSDQPHVDVQYGPTGVQWCSNALLASVGQASEHTGRRVHMHLLETKPQRDWADANYPAGVVSHLDEIGLLSERLTLAHCVWARPDELALIAKSGARIAVNNSSNMHLFSGRAPVAQILAAGVPLAMGLDGCALDEDDDALRELRLLYLLGRSPGFQTGCMTKSLALKSACRTGRAALGLPDGGYLATGLPADLITLDLRALDRDMLLPVPSQDLLLARASTAHICDIWSKGRQVVRDGEVLGIDLDASQELLREAYRKALPGTEHIRTVWPAIGAAISDHYKGCC